MEIYTPEQAAEKLSVGVATVQAWLRTGKLKGTKIGRIWRITDDDIGELMSSSR